MTAARASSRSVDRFGGLNDPEGRRLRARRVIVALKALAGLDVAHARVLDVGCSAGLMTHELATLAARVIGVDVDADALGIASRTPGTACFVLASGERLPFADGSFDAVVCNHIYEHVPSAPALMVEIRRVLCSGGACYLAVGHTLQLVEPHYRLPLLSMMPRRWASACLRMTGRASSYEERFLPPWRLRSLGEGFTSMRLVSPQMLAAPDQFGFPKLAALPSPVRRLLAATSPIVARLAPTWIFLLRK